LGLGADLLVVDDAIADSNSDSECEAAFDWLQRIASGRLNKGGRIIVIGQRLRETDLIGRILEDASIGQQFRVINLPAICQDEDLDIERTLGRRNGDCLWPAQFGLDELSVRRNLMGEISFACQFLGNPIPTGGHGLIQPEWLLGNRYDRIPDDGKVSFAIDAAAKTGLKNDYSALCVLKSTKTHHYLVDMIRSKVDYNGLKRILLEAAKAYEPDVIYIEDTSNGVALVQQLRAETDLPIVPKSAKGSKVSRWEAQTGTLEAGRLLIPADRLARPWLTEFLREMLSLPNSRFDDQADALFLALAQVAKPSRELIFATLSTVAGRPAKSAIYGADSDPYVSNGPAGQAVYDTFTGELVSGTPRRARDPWDDIPRARPRPAPSPRVSHRW
jgi:predicted phage terminase large subunit-like protein